MAVNGSAMTVAHTSAVDPVVAEAMTMSARLAPLRNALGLQDFNDQELDLFAMVALRMRLDPFARQIHAIKRQGKVTFQVGIDGFRSSAEETDQYRGSDEPEYGPIIEKPWPHPEWAQVTVHRQYPDGTWLHQSATAYFDEFLPGQGQDFQWKKMPRVMLAKCAEAAAFRKAFPKRFGQVYVPEEMQQADAAAAATPIQATVTSHRDRIAAQAAALTTHAAADDKAAATDTTPVPRAPDPVAEPAAEAIPSASVAGEADIVDGQAVEVAGGGVTGGELREWLREHRITIPVAREVCMRMFRVDSFDALTDEQRGHLVLELDGGARA